MTLEFLVLPGPLGEKTILASRVRTPDGALHPVERTADEPTGPLPPPRPGSAQVMGRTLRTLEYALPGGRRAVWSRAVPGLGLVRLEGPGERLALEAFGVGGDPWEEGR